MTEIKPDEMMQEVMRRTMFNLRFIQARRSEAGPFEVVQLVNSFTGAMVHPWEAIRDNDPLGLKHVSLQAARDREWPVLTTEDPVTDVDPRCYWQMLQWTRNAIAHGNVNFANSAGEIAEVRIWNERNGERIWGAVLSVQDMEGFLWFFYDLTHGVMPKRRSAHPRILGYAAD